jgi:hypothetical protein
MKKILTLLVCTLVVSATFAQTDAQKEEAKRVILGPKKTSSTKTSDDRSVILGGDDRTVYGEPGSRYPNRYPSTSTSRDQRINDINRAYDAKIYSIRRNPTLSQSEKDRIIRQLEAERRRRIEAIDGRHYDKGRCDDDDHEYKKGKKHKGNPGNHYGWEKGKGNPHKEN